MANDLRSVGKAGWGLSIDELARLIHATEKSQMTSRGLDGSTRAMLYRVAMMTGLRASELASLTAASFDLTADPPTVTPKSIVFNRFQLAQ
ncbi:MAG TPA: hypothetical protein VK137_19445 [Planctomycetaceae bacterium]|nr:hypothetical protein [Planctomycetaceae bacterium]